MGFIVFSLILAYFLGSIPSSVWIGRRFYGIDVREHGSKNAGATNTLRVLGRKAAIPVFIIDFFKGFVAVKLALLSNVEMSDNGLFIYEMGLAVCAVVGHIFPIFVGFKGGKGVATITGAVFAVYSYPVLCALGVFIITFLLTNYVSLGSIFGAISLPFFLIFVFNEKSTAAIIMGCIVAATLVLTHRKNIKRLISGNESKVYPFKGIGKKFKKNKN
ncbi:MAG: glycerol-3-phosphate 1-O-acyltransferase PlsY [Rikenellaceae bacterium]